MSSSPRSSSRWSSSRTSSVMLGADLEAHGPAEPAAAQLDLDGGEQVVGLLLLEGEVGVAGDPERGGGLDLHAGEELVEVGGDHLLERHEPLAVGHHHEPGQQVGHLHPGEAPLAGDRVAEQHGEVQRQVRDVGERVARVDGERGEHREDPLLERLDEVLLVVVVELVPARTAGCRSRPARARPRRGRAAAGARRAPRPARGPRGAAGRGCARRARRRRARRPPGPSGRPPAPGRTRRGSG